jgi:hypothetical protein
MSNYQHRGAIALAFILTVAGVAALLSGFAEMKEVAATEARTCSGNLHARRQSEQTLVAPDVAVPRLACELQPSPGERPR